MLGLWLTILQQGVDFEVNSVAVEGGSVVLTDSNVSSENLFTEFLYPFRPASNTSAVNMFIGLDYEMYSSLLGTIMSILFQVYPESWLHQSGIRQL